ncbi:MAG: phosphotransferase [Nocardioidaceae bacterium]|nr:phosphotransferase [Nocardioidaceae bacterium]
MTSEVLEVVAAAIVREGRVLAARRTRPADLAGRWEFPGGKLEPGETGVEALKREVLEELGCDIEIVRQLAHRTAIKPGYALTIHLARLVGSELSPHEHDAARWLGPEELDQVDWLPADRPFLAELRDVLLDGEPLAGGNVGGAVRVGSTVRRSTGPWTPAVHALLGHLAAAGLAESPRVLGTDRRGREVLTYLPGRVIDVDVEDASDALLSDAMRWLRRYHDSVVDFEHPGPWRNEHNQVGAAERVLCHHDFAPYNVATSTSAEGDRLVGVFDWDMAGPGTRLEDLAFAAWSWTPMHRRLPDRETARRLRLMAASYGRNVDPCDILGGVVPRLEDSIKGIAAGQAAGDAGMLNLAKVGEPHRTRGRLDELRDRVPHILARLEPSP